MSVFISVLLLFATSAIAVQVSPAQPPPAELAAGLKLTPFYQKHVSVRGFPVLGSANVSDYALLEAAYLIDHMLEGREDVRAALIANKVRFVVMAWNEFTTQVPEHSTLKPKGYWDKRARGLGATRDRPAVSCGEENLLGYAGDPYGAENILIHEFGHAIHEMGLSSANPGFDKRLKAAYESAMQRGLWKGKYASQNRMEYWAEGVQSWFDTNRENDHDHNHVNTREELKAYDSPLAALLAEVFGDKPWRYIRPAKRGAEERMHLAGFDAGRAPRFVWPEMVLAGWRTYEAEKSGSTLPELPRLPKPKPTPSSAGSRKTSVLFVNQTKSDVLLYWSDGSGKRTLYNRVRPNNSETHETYVGHVWVATDAANQVLATVAAGEKPGKVTLR
jgi:hypothetical protein